MRYIKLTKRTLSELGASESRVVPKYSVLFVSIGSTIGKVAQNFTECSTNQQINTVIPYENVVNSFVYYNLELRAPAIALIAGHQAVPIINKSTFSKVKLPFPKEREEQQKIADTLNSLDALITAHTDKLTALREHKQGLLQQLFPGEGELVPGLRFGGFVGEWEEARLETVGPPLMCKRILKEQTTVDPEDTIPFYKIGTFGKQADAYIDEQLYRAYREKYSFPKVGDILISASGTIGRLVVYDGADAYFQDSNIVWIGNNEELVLNEFLYYAYKIVNWQTSDGGVIKRLYNTNLKEMIISYPKDEKEQQKIADCLASQDDLIAAQAKKIKTLRAHKKGLMQRLFPSHKI